MTESNKECFDDYFPSKIERQSKACQTLAQSNLFAKIIIKRS